MENNHPLIQEIDQPQTNPSPTPPLPPRFPKLSPKFLVFVSLILVTAAAIIATAILRRPSPSSQNRPRPTPTSNPITPTPNPNPSSFADQIDYLRQQLNSTFDPPPPQIDPNIGL